MMVYSHVMGRPVKYPCAYDTILHGSSHDLKITDLQDHTVLCYLFMLFYAMPFSRTVVPFCAILWYIPMPYYGTACHFLHNLRVFRCSQMRRCILYRIFCSGNYGGWQTMWRSALTYKSSRRIIDHQPSNRPGIRACPVFSLGCHSSRYAPLQDERDAPLLYCSFC
jgi:hypothetical protein